MWMVFNMEAKFIFVVKNHYSIYGKQYQPSIGPYFDTDVKDLGKKFIYALSELLTMTSLTKTMRKNLNSARPGRLIKYHHLSSASDMYIRRLTQEEIEAIEKEELLINELKCVEEEIASKTVELQIKKKELEKEKRIQHKLLEKLNLR